MRTREMSLDILDLFWLNRFIFLLANARSIARVNETL